MEHEYIIAQEIKSKSQVHKFIYIEDFFFCVGYMAISFLMRNIVHTKLQILFMIFSFLMCVFLTSRSIYNRRRRNYESIFILLRKDNLTYRPLKMRKKNNEKK